MNKIELRWLRRKSKEYPTHGVDSILQYRVASFNQWADDDYVWSDWQDAPVVDEPVLRR